MGKVPIDLFINYLRREEMTTLDFMRKEINNFKIGEWITRQDLMNSSYRNCSTDSTIDTLRRLLTLAEYLHDDLSKHTIRGRYKILSHIPEDLTLSQLKYRARPDTYIESMRPEWEKWKRDMETKKLSKKYGI